MSILRRENNPKRVAKRASRALEAAKGPSLAPKGYKPDTEGRKKVDAAATNLQSDHWDTSATGPRVMQLVKAKTRKAAYEQAAKDDE